MAGIPGGFFAKFFGRVPSEAAGYAIGGAVSGTLKPAVQDIENTAWSNHPVMKLDAGVAAQLAAEFPDLHDFGAQEAAQHGIEGTRFDHLRDLSQTAPGLAPLFEAWRRDLINDAAFEHGLHKAKLEPQWLEPLKGLKSRLLSLDQLANARQQGFITDVRQKAEALLQGQDGARAEIAFELAGLPPGPETMQEAVNRGLTDRTTFDQAIREGHTKTKYTDLLYALRQPVLSADEYATLHLKGWITEADMNTGGALHGYDASQMNLKFLEKGRPAAPGQLWTAAARGIDGPAKVPMNEVQFTKAIQESDIRPEYAPMLWAIRYLYPSLFQLSRLVQSQAIDANTAADWATKARYAPEVVAALKASWAAPAAGKADTHLAKAQQQLWTRTHTSFVNGESDEVAARDRLGQAGVPAGLIGEVLALWNGERTLIRKQLTPAQIKKAYLKGVVNPTSGAAWTRDEAIAALLELGYDENDSIVFLDTV